MTTFHITNEYNITKEMRRHHHLKQKKFKSMETFSWKNSKRNSDNVFNTDESNKIVKLPKQKYDTTYYFSRKLILGDHNRKGKGKMGKASWTLRAYKNNNYIRSIINDNEIVVKK